MDEFLRVVTSDFELVATSTGFRFNQYSGSVDWENLEKCVVRDIVEKTDVKSLSLLVASVLSYNIEKMSASKKIFRLSQLIIDFLLHCKKYSSLNLSGKADSMALCELCGKMFIDMNYLKYHCFRRHTLNSCSYTSTSEDQLVESLKSKIVELQTQLEEIKSNFQNNFQDSIEQKLNSCHAVHKNKLMYHLIPQSGDNPMQTQEIYWKQKYDSLEETCNILKNKLEKDQNTTKINAGLHHKYQQCEIFTPETSSTSVQTQPQIENITVISPIRPRRNIDVTHINENEKTCAINNIPVTDEINVEYHERWNGDGSSDRDFYELKKLRLEAHMNITENNISEDFSKPLLSSDYVDRINVVLILGKTRVNDLLKNDSLMDLIKLEVKETVNTRLEEFYKLIDENIEHDSISQERSSCEKKESCEVSICNDINIEQNSSPIIDYDKNSVKKNKTVISKLKKKALRIGKVFSPDSKPKK